MLLLGGTAQAAEFQGTVIRVIDGDSLIVLRKGDPVKVRLYGVDCPERNKPYSRQATAMTKALCLDRRVRVIVRDWDHYGRTVAEILVPPGINVGHELVKAGLARWYRQYAGHDKTLERTEATARKQRCGIWSR